MYAEVETSNPVVSETTDSKKVGRPKAQPLVTRLSQAPPTTPFPTSRRSLFYSGGHYQLKLALLLLCRANSHGHKLFLGMPVQRGMPPSLDDLLFSFEDSRIKRWQYRWVQFKHRFVEDVAEITAADFLKANGRLSLQEYYEQHCQLKNQDKFPNWNTLDQFLILVHPGIKISDLTAAGIILCKVAKRDSLFHPVAGGKPLQLYRISSFPVSFRQLLGKGLEVVQLASELAQRILGGKGLTLNTEIFLKYHFALVAENVIVGTVVNGCKVGMLSAAFLAQQFSSFRAANFYTAFFEAIKKQDPLGKKWPMAANKQFKVFNGFGIYKPGVSNVLPVDWNSDADIEEFRTKLFLAFNVPREAELTRLVQEELGCIFNLIDGSFVFDQLWTWLQDQMPKQQGGYCRSLAGGKDLLDAIHQKLLQWNMIGVMTNNLHRMLALQGHFIFPKCHLEPLASILDVTKLARVNTSCVSLTVIKMCQLLKWRTENDYAVIDICRLTILSTFALRAFKLPTPYWLVVEMVPVPPGEVTKTVQALRQVVKTALLDHEGIKKVVLISEEQNTICDMVLFGKPHRVYQDNEVVFQATDTLGQMLLLDNPLTFQKHPVQLRELMPDTKELAELDARLLNKIVNGEAIRLGRTLKLGDLRRALPYYVPRRLQLYLRFDWKGLGAPSTTGNLLLLTGISQREILKVISEEQVRRFEDGSWVTATPDVKVILFTSMSSADEYFEHVRAKFPNRTVYWFHIDGQFYMLKRPPNPAGTRCKLSSPFVTVITGSPGMGKSVALGNLVITEKRHKPLNWILKANLANFQTQLATDRFTDVDSVLKFLYLSNGLAETYEQTWLEHCVVHRGCITLYLDGFDQLEWKARANVVHAIRILKTTRVDAIWLATQACHWSELEAEVASLRYDLLPLTRLDQQTFLAKYWSARLKEKGIPVNAQRMSTYAQQFLQRMEQLGHEELPQWLGNPLLAQMMANVYWQDLQPVFASEDGSALQLMTAPPPTQLELCKHYARENILQGLAHAFDPQTYLEDCARFTDIHGHLAIFHLFGDEAWKHGFLEDQLKSKDKKVLLGMKMLHQNSGGRLRFTNRMLAEYFATHQLAEMAQNHGAQRDLAVAFLKETYFSELLDSFRIVLDRTMARNHDLLEAVLRGDGDEVCEIAKHQPRLVNFADELGRTPLHLAAMYSQDDIFSRLISAKWEPDVNALDAMDFTPLCYALALVNKSPTKSRNVKTGLAVSFLARHLSGSDRLTSLKLLVPIIEQRKSNRQHLIKAVNSWATGFELAKVADVLDCADVIRQHGYRFEDVCYLLDMASDSKRCELLCMDDHKLLKNAINSESWAIFAWIAKNLTGKTLHAIEDTILNATELASRLATYIHQHNFVGLGAAMHVLTFRVRKELWRRVEYRQMFWMAMSEQEVHLVADLLSLFGNENLFEGHQCSQFFMALLQSPYRDCYFAWMLDRLHGSELRRMVLASMDHVALFRSAVLNRDLGMLTCLVGCTDCEKTEMKNSLCLFECQHVFHICLDLRDNAMLQLLLRFVGAHEQQNVFAYLNVEVDGFFSFELLPDMDELCIAQIGNDLDDYARRDYEWSIWGHLIYALLKLQICTQT